MANNYTRATISPELPKDLFNTSELRSLKAACGISGQPHGGTLYLYAEDWFSETGNDDEGREVNCAILLQEKLHQLDPQHYPHITIEGSSACDKMRPGEFGGFAYFITRAEIRYMSTWEWLHMAEAMKPPTPETGELLAALRAILPYAESEAESLAECHRREGGLELQPYVEACEAALATARAVLTKYEGGRS